MTIDPKFRVPQSIMSWFVKQLVGVVLPLLKKQAKYVSKVTSTVCVQLTWGGMDAYWGSVMRIPLLFL